MATRVVKPIKTARVVIRTYPEQKTCWEQKARSDGRNLANWAEFLLNRDSGWQGIADAAAPKAPTKKRRK